MPIPKTLPPLICIAEVQRKQGQMPSALTTIRKATKMDASNLEAGYNEALLLDALGQLRRIRLQAYEKMVDLTSHANGAYTNEEKSNRSFFPRASSQVYHEEEQDRSWPLPPTRRW